MKIASVQTFAVEAGWKIYGFLKVTTSTGMVGWAEFSPTFAGRSSQSELASLGDAVTGHEIGSAHIDELLTQARATWLGQRAAGAMSNALLDIRSQMAGASVCELLGGSAPDGPAIPVYWAHCGTYRTTHAKLLGTTRLRDLDDITELGREVRSRGFGCVKINPLVARDGVLRRHKPTQAEPARPDEVREVVAPALDAQIAALRRGAGEDLGVMVDLGPGYTVEAALALGDVLAASEVAWVELEGLDPSSLGPLKDGIGVPIATGERLLASQYQGYLDAGAVDVMVIDVLFHGVESAIEIANLCDRHSTFVAPHNCYGPLATVAAATFCALVANNLLMELDVDTVSWDADLITPAPRPIHGTVGLLDGPGWGVEVHEDVLRDHAPPAANNPPPTPTHGGASAICETT